MALSVRRVRLFGTEFVLLLSVAERWAESSLTFCFCSHISNARIIIFFGAKNTKFFHIFSLLVFISNYRRPRYNGVLLCCPLSSTKQFVLISGQVLPNESDERIRWLNFNWNFVFHSSFIFYSSKAIIARVDHSVSTKHTISLSTNCEYLVL